MSSNPEALRIYPRGPPTIQYSQSLHGDPYRDHRPAPSVWRNLHPLTAYGSVGMTVILGGGGGSVPSAVKVYLAIFRHFL